MSKCKTGTFRLAFTYILRSQVDSIRSMFSALLLQIVSRRWVLIKQTFCVFILALRPATIVGLRNETVTYGIDNSVDLFCDVSGNPAPQVTWFKSGESLEPNRLTADDCETIETGYYYYNHDLQRTKLVICKPEVIHKGHYTCLAKNQLGNENRTAYLNVLCKYFLSLFSSRWQISNVFRFLHLKHIQNNGKRLGITIDIFGIINNYWCRGNQIGLFLEGPVINPLMDDFFLLIVVFFCFLVCSFISATVVCCCTTTVCMLSGFMVCFVVLFFPNIHIYFP